MMLRVTGWPGIEGTKEVGKEKGRKELLTSESEKEVIRSSTRRGILPLSVGLMGEVSGKGSVCDLGFRTLSRESEYEVLDTLVM